MRKLESSLTVDVPRKELDRPSWVSVGGIAAVCFVIGVAWPKLAGVRLGPSAPGEAAAAAAAASSGSSAGRASDALRTTPVASLAAPNVPNALATTATTPAAGAIATGAAVTTPTASLLAVKGGQITSCKTEDGDTLKGKACGALGFDAVALPRLKRLSTCPASAEADGKLSVMVHLDFAKSRVTADVGKSSSVASADAFAACLKPALEGAPLANVNHEHPRYTVNYALHFTRDKASAGAAANIAPASAVVAPLVTARALAAAPVSASSNVAPTFGTPAGGTEIVWDGAVVRDAPKTGAVVARLPRGTKVQLGAPQDGWYKVKFSDAPAEGWVYRGAVGK